MQKCSMSRHMLIEKSFFFFISTIWLFWGCRFIPKWKVLEVLNVYEFGDYSQLFIYLFSNCLHCSITYQVSTGVPNCLAVGAAVAAQQKQLDFQDLILGYFVIYRFWEQRVHRFDRKKIKRLYRLIFPVEYTDCRNNCCGGSTNWCILYIFI